MIRLLRPAVAIAAFASALGLHAQSSLHVRNNAWLDFSIHLRQSGSATGSAHTLMASTLTNWQPDTEVFSIPRDTSIVGPGDSLIYHITFRTGADSVEVQLQFQRNPGGTGMVFRHALPGSAPGPWLSDGNFHQATTTLGGLPITLQYKPDNDDSQQSRDIRLAIHQTPLYTIDPADFSDPQVIHLMAYNIQFLPLGVVGLPQAADRGDLLPAAFSPYQDVVAFQEAFDPLPRLLNLIPAMQAAGFPHNSGILNDYLPFNGGVIIFSKWPIEATAQYDFALCGPNSQDCLANKGIMYARINKLGTRYHIFGTHFDAGSDSLDLAAKNLQYAEMRDFIAAQSIPPTEAVLICGDLNTAPTSGHNLYANLLDSLNPVVPEYAGFQSSTMGTDTAYIIDHIFTDHRHLLPLSGQVRIETFRSIHPDLWELSDFSDHRAAVGRFSFPALGFGPGDHGLCPGDPTAFSASASIPVSYAWHHNGQPLGNSSATHSIAAATPADSGTYTCAVSYSRTFGTATDPVNAAFYPNGPVTHSFNGQGNAGHLQVDAAFCPNTSPAPTASGSLRAWPHPATHTLQVAAPSAGLPLQLRLLDLQGRSLLSASFPQGTASLDVHALPAGAYILRASQPGRPEARLPILITR